MKTQAEYTREWQRKQKKLNRWWGREERHGLVVDHNHRTGRVRGLLCNLCNVAGGRIERFGLSKVKRYLRR